MRGQMQFAFICFWAVLAPYNRWLLTWKIWKSLGISEWSGKSEGKRF